MSNDFLIRNPAPDAAAACIPSPGRSFTISARGAQPPDGPWSRELIKEIAADIGKDTVAYVEVMYPNAIKATTSTFKLSLRNHIHNQVMSAIELIDETGVRAWLAARKTHRREWLAAYRKMRKADEVEPLEDASKVRALAECVKLRERGWLPHVGWVKGFTFTVEEAETVEKALNLLAELEDRTIEGDHP